VINYQLYNPMNSPLPIAIGTLSALQAGSFAKIAHRAIFKRSALQRGAKYFTPPSFVKRAGGHSRQPMG
jgi:hypothetical protein